jgi:hypothetical protein
MILVIPPEKAGIREIREGQLYSASFREREREFPFLLHVSGNRLSMFSTSLMPIGWVETQEGRPGDVVRVLPDPRRIRN